MKLTIKKTSLKAGIILIMFCSFQVSAQSLVDINGNNYKTIINGTQEWTASNLTVASFRNGDIIPEAKTPEEWTTAGKSGKPAWCNFDNNPENGIKYGKLYNWYAINDPRGLAPEGWHISINADWRALIKSLKGVDVAGIKLKNNTGWKSRNGQNTIGFSALPGGSRDEKGEFKNLETKGQWWSNSKPVESVESNQIYSVSLNSFTNEISYIKVNKETGLSVRCIKD